MTRRFLIAAGAAILAAAGLVVLGQGRADLATQPIAAIADARGKPKLALLTSLPILFGEQFGLDAAASPVLADLQRSYQVEGIGVADAASLKGRRLLLMAHPRAQPAEALVALDAWVRRGGRLLLLADPRLDWSSERPLGDRLRPPPDFADTGLLRHWGLALSGPTIDGPVMVDADGIAVMAVRPGQLATASRHCTLVAAGFIARCTIGRGQVTVLADADFLNIAGPGAIDGPTDRNLELVTRELARLSR